MDNNMGAIQFSVDAASHGECADVDNITRVRLQMTDINL